jgi:alginate O-acetyltransferase complex protein AlgI
MQFNTIEYLIFLPVVVAVYYLLPYSWRWIWLITAIFIFLSCNPWFIIPLLAVALVEYGMAILIENSRSINTYSGCAFLMTPDTFSS